MTTTLNNRLRKRAFILKLVIILATTLGGAFGQTNVAAGSGPSSVAVNPVTNKIYVANSFSGNVTVIDGATNSTSPSRWE